MKHLGWAVLGIALVTLATATAELQNVNLSRRPSTPAPMPSLEHLAQPPEGVDLQFLERFALAEDRAEVLKELVPGTELYYYFSCLHQLEIGGFREVETLLEAWIGHHGETAQVRAIRNRQALLRYLTRPSISPDLPAPASKKKRR